MPVELFGDTNVGRVRGNNEDSFTIVEELSMAIVADGMGGAACGEVASAMTVETIREFVKYPPEPLEEEQLLKEAIRAANQVVYDKAQREDSCQGMGSTVVLAAWKNANLWIANVGDSRAYRWRGGEMKQLSYDQNLANELRVNLGLSEEQISQYPHRNALTMAIGTAADVLVRTHSDQLEDGDLILLCSDGLYGPAGDDGIREILAQNGDLKPMTEKLITRALDGGGPDNVTVVLLRYRS